MSQRTSKSSRAVAELVSEAHCAIHLLLDLSTAITNPAAAAECKDRAEMLTRAVQRAARRCELYPHIHQNHRLSRPSPTET